MGYLQRVGRLPESRTEALRWYIDLQVAAEQNGDWETESVPANDPETPPYVRPGVKAWLGRHDLYFLLVFLLHRATDLCPMPMGGRDEKGADWLFARCREVQAKPDGRIDLWAREHYKSTFITLGLTIQDILNDPEDTFGIFSDVNKTAKPFLRQIKLEFEANDELKATYPDVLWADPQNESPKWSENEGITVRRQGNPKECTVEAYGLIDGQPTGRHFKVLIFDDLVSLETVGSDTMMAKLRTRWELADSLGSNMPNKRARRRIVGTRYFLFDVYRTILDRKSAIPRIYPCTENGEEDGEPVLMSRELIAEKRRDQGPYTFGAQMLLNPTADKAQGFDEKWLRYWPCQRFDNLNKYLLVDPSGGKKPGSKSKKGTGDFTSIWVIGVGADGNLYVCDHVRDRFNLTGRCRAVMALHRKWKPLKVGYEEYGMQADIEALKWLQNQETYRFEITALGGQTPKPDRIKRLIPWFEGGRVYLPEHGIVRLNVEKQAVDVIRTFIDEELLAFPLCAHDDSLDSLSRILDEEIALSVELVLPEDDGDDKLRTDYAEADDPGTGWMGA